MLRETIMGPELFDKAFWRVCPALGLPSPQTCGIFPHPEDASAVDLDWFWRWFYTTDVCDQSIDKVRWFRVAKTKTVSKQRKSVKSGI